MDDTRTDVIRAAEAAASPAELARAAGAGAHEPPRFRVIPLDCEITAYAPDGDQPLF